MQKKKTDFVRLFIFVFTIIMLYIMALLPDNFYPGVGLLQRVMFTTIFIAVVASIAYFINKNRQQRWDELNQEWDIHTLENDLERLYELQVSFQKVILTKQSSVDSHYELYELLGLKNEGPVPMGTSYDYETLQEKGHRLADLLEVPFEDKSLGW